MASIIPVALFTLVQLTATSDAPQPLPAGSGTCQGAVGGLSPDVHDAMFFTFEENEYPRMTVLLTSFVGGCPDWSPAPPNVDDFEQGNIIGLQLAGRDVIERGVYLVGEDSQHVAAASVQFVRQTGFDATGGTVELTYLSDTRVEGIYELTFDGAAITGTFSAGYCPSLISSPMHLN